MNAEKHADFAVPNILKSVTTNHLKPARLGIGVISAGKVGAVLGAALRAAGHSLVGVHAVSEASQERADVLLPGVPYPQHRPARGHRPRNAAASSPAAAECVTAQPRNRAGGHGIIKVQPRRQQ